MSKEIKILDDTVTNQPKCQHPKNPIWIENVDIDQKLVFVKVNFDIESYKYSIGYKDDENLFD